MERYRVREARILSDEYTRLRAVSFDLRRADASWQTLEREVYERRDAAAVLPFDPARGTIILVRQFRLPATQDGGDGMLLEAIAGVLEGAPAEDTVIREALEEAGIRLRSVTRVLRAIMSPGCLTERLTLFTASYNQADRVARGGGLRAEGEDIEVVEMTLAAALALIPSGGITDAKTIMLLQHLSLAGGRPG